jgi:hypothetical protein
MEIVIVSVLLLVGVVYGYYIRSADWDRGPLGERRGAGRFLCDGLPARQFVGRLRVTP